VKDLEGRPEAKNLVGIYAALTGTTSQSVLDEFAGEGFGVFKPRLAEVAVEFLSPIADTYARLLSDRAEIDRILAAGAEKAASVASPVIEEARDLVGYWRR
jgi:tryptophanyl-tRNA synthetase